MTTINDLLTVTVSIEYHAISTDDGDQTPVSESYEETFGAADEITYSILRDIAEAAEEGNLYGWMQQEMINSRIGAGDLRKETSDEMVARMMHTHSAVHRHPDNTDAIVTLARRVAGFIGTIRTTVGTAPPVATIEFEDCTSMDAFTDLVAALRQATKTGAPT